jgi:hypothetical protein
MFKLVLYGLSMLRILEHLSFDLAEYRESCGGLAVEHATHNRKVVGLIPCPVLNGSGVKAMPGSIPAPNSGSLQKKKQLAKWGTPTMFIKKRIGGTPQKFH